MQPSVGCKKGWNKLLKRCQEFGWTRPRSAAAVLSGFCHRKTLQHSEQEISLPLLITNNLYLLLHFWVFFCFALEGTEQVVMWSCMWCWGIPPLCSLQSVVCDKNTYLLLKMLEFLPECWRRSYTSFVKLIGKLEWEKFSSYLQAQKVMGRTRQRSEAFDVLCSSTALVVLGESNLGYFPLSVKNFPLKYWDLFKQLLQGKKNPTIFNKYYLLKKSLKISPGIFQNICWSTVPLHNKGKLLVF